MLLRIIKDINFLWFILDHIIKLIFHIILKIILFHHERTQVSIIREKQAKTCKPW